MRDYIAQMRRLVGHAPLLVIGSGVLIENERGELLLEKRADDGTWCIPGGCMDFGESCLETAAREVYEETGLTVKNLSLFGVYSGESCVHEYPNGDVCFGALVIFYTKSFSGELWTGAALAKAGESLELKFFGREALPENLTRPDCLYIEKWRRGDMSVVVV